MPLANRYRGGEGFWAQFAGDAGTVIFSGEYTTFDVDRNIDMIEVTAGNETDGGYIKGIKKGSASLKYYDNTGTVGTNMEAAFTEGAYGTLLYGPQGTVATKPKRGFACFVKSFKAGYPNDDKVELEVEFEKNGAVLFGAAAVWP